jgi:NADPH-dependent 2,4-dienoyl-CoA reductase/sulfur reductase-like enzyme
MASKTVVILGGGIGGIVAANERARGTQHGARLCSLVPVANDGDRKPQDIKQPLPKLLESGVEFVHGSVEGLDLPKQQVKTTVGTLGYDYLIVALGAELAPEAVPGLKEDAETFYIFGNGDCLQRATCICLRRSRSPCRSPVPNTLMRAGNSMEFRSQSDKRMSLEIRNSKKKVGTS